MKEKKLYLSDRDLGDETDQGARRRWAGITAESLVKQTNIYASFQGVVKEYRPDSWTLEHWQDHVNNQLIHAYQDRRRLEGRSEEHARVLAYMDVVMYLIERPDKPWEWAYRNRYS